MTLSNLLTAALAAVILSVLIALTVYTVAMVRIRAVRKDMDRRIERSREDFRRMYERRWGIQDTKKKEG